MATLTAYQPFNQLVDGAIQLIYDTPVDYRADGNVITQATYQAVNGEFLTLYGRVSGDTYETSTGVLFGFREDNGTGIKYSVTDFALDWQQYVNFTERTNDTIGLQSTVLRGNDTFLGSRGSDFMLGFDGSDTMYGGGAASAPVDGNDTLLGNGGNDALYGNGGDDILLGGSDLFDTSDVGDALYGGLGNDTIYAGGGDDVISGGTGNDLIVGAQGNDLILGGEGRDIYVFVRDEASFDTIIDFQQGDILSIQGGGSFQNILSRAVSDANGTFLALPQGGGITLAGVQQADLDAGDFYFF